MVYGSVYGNGGGNLDDVEAAVYDESLSFDEIGALAIEESVNDWNQMMRGIAISELSYVAENGKEMIYEGVDIVALKDKIVGWFKKLWARIKALADTAIAKFMSWGKNDEGFIEKYEDKIRAGVSDLESGFSFNGYKFSKANMEKYPDLVKSESDSEISRAKSAKAVVMVNTELLKGHEKEFKESIKKYRGKLCGSTAKSSDADFKKELRKYLYGSESKVPIHKTDIDTGSMISDVKGCADAIEGAKEMRDSIKESIDTCIDDVNARAEQYKGWTGSDKSDKFNANTKNAASYMQKYGAYLKQVQTVNAAAFTTYIAALRDRNRQNKALCVKLVSAANVKSTPMKESAGSLLSGKFAEVIL